MIANYFLKKNENIQAFIKNVDKDEETDVQRDLARASMHKEKWTPISGDSMLWALLPKPNESDIGWIFV